MATVAAGDPDRLQTVHHVGCGHRARPCRRDQIVESVRVPQAVRRRTKPFVIAPGRCTGNLHERRPVDVVANCDDAPPIVAAGIDATRTTFIDPIAAGVDRPGLDALLQDQFGEVVHDRIGLRHPDVTTLPAPRHASVASAHRRAVNWSGKKIGFSAKSAAVSG